MQPEFALFYYKRRLSVGWIVSRETASLRLLLADGTKISRPGAQVLLRWRGSGGTPAGQEEALARLAAGEIAMAKAAPTLNLEELHGGLPKDRETAFTKLAALALPSQADGWSRAALHMALLQAPRLFRHGKKGFAALGPDTQQLQSQKREAAAAQADWQARAARWCEQLQQQRWQTGGEGDVFIKQLESLLALERRSPHWKLLAAPLGLSPARMDEAKEKLRGWLAAAGRWRGWPALWLLAGEVEQAFDPALESQATNLATAPPRLRGRSDLRRLPAYTIDAQDTRDIDDACAILAADDEGLTVALHIAEPSAALAPGQELFEEAARRMSSVYTSDAVYPMFPPLLSQGRFSLLAGEEREALTFTLRLEEAGARLVKIDRSMVRVTENLNYAGAEALLAHEGPTWGRLRDYCEKLRAERVTAGAVLGHRVGVSIDHSDPERIKLVRYDRSGPAQRLVEELAILLNREVGLYCRKHRLPAIYRVQPRPTGGSGARPQPRFDVKGAPHAGLACERYVQVTSPIRRFTDLVMQQQIGGHAAQGRATHRGRNLMMEWAARADKRLAAYAELERRIESYWKRRWLIQQSGRNYQGTLRRRGSGGQDKVWLEEPQLLADARISAGMKQGDAFLCRVLEVDADRERVLVEPAKTG
ncbi:MAG: RNB domain-containing ribonuclease [SAR324 cluster bacterium]|nr:RNB domain-containing ribonuclease [SAR324 cluster bacterium]